ncbi:prephenate dehydratase domain-containing protein [Rufibacter sp. LB8]|uniref:prephenate dehydratase n=1 Tax=Rufibacter sp. LB8 TaxID=2777781 RepID=UPI00178C1E87|nr:prephenate dehydratase domain-containing protein [Rufibacter sp. LB8]
MDRTLKIAIQGGPASFHETAAKELFASSGMQTMSCASFPELCQALASGLADYAVMAVQNSVAGPILSNYSLLAAHGFYVAAERWLFIDQTLMALPGQTMADLKEIWSHPIALLQCCDFVQNSGLISKETADTADTARQLKEEQISGVAAIASRRAADLYGLEVLQGNVANQPDNFTRFLVISRQATSSASDKATVLLPYPVVQFSLENVVEVLATSGVTLTMLQPLPAAHPGQPQAWVLEMESEQTADLTHALARLQGISPNHQVLGLYKKAVSPLPKERLNGCLPTTLRTSTPELV